MNKTSKAQATSRMGCSFHTMKNEFPLISYFFNHSHRIPQCTRFTHLVPLLIFQVVLSVFIVNCSNAPQPGSNTNSTKQTPIMPTSGVSGNATLSTYVATNSTSKGMIPTAISPTAISPTASAPATSSTANATLSEPQRNKTLGAFSPNDPFTLSLQKEFKDKADAAIQEMGNALYEKKDYANSLRHYLELVRRNTKELTVYAHLGYIHHKMDAFLDPKKALHYYNLAVELINESLPNTFQFYDWVFNLRGMLKHIPYGDIDGALQDYSRAIEINPNNYEALNNRGALYMLNLGDTELAEKDLFASIDKSPTYSKALCNLGILYYQYKKDYEKATEYLNKTVNIDPRFGEAYYFLGLLYIQGLKNCTQGKQYLTTAKSLLDAKYYEKIDPILDECLLK